MNHGYDCPKVVHIGEGYLHDALDDKPYDVDGVMYCGRCHGWLGNPLAAPPSAGQEGLRKCDSKYMEPDGCRCPCHRGSTCERCDYAPSADLLGEREGNMDQLRKEIETSINRVSAENGSNTPDFILAEFLTDCLAAFDKASRAREKWYGKELKIGG